MFTSSLMNEVGALKESALSRHSMLLVYRISRLGWSRILKLRDQGARAGKARRFSVLFKVRCPKTIRHSDLTLYEVYTSSHAGRIRNLVGGSEFADIRYSSICDPGNRGSYRNTILTCPNMNLYLSIQI